MSNNNKINKISKEQIKDFKEKLLFTPISVWDKADASTRKEIFKLGEQYKAFLDQTKTERLTVEYIYKRAYELGFNSLNSNTKTGLRFYIIQQNKAIALCVLGKKGVGAGVRIIGSHIDAPRLDLKMRSLYENQELAFLKTHYYGGIKKYQWLARPLALHGVICTRENKVIQIHIGETKDDPVFTLLDLLPHLGRKIQDNKKVFDAFEAERMNLLVGGLPLDLEEVTENDKVKLAILNILYERYCINEADLISAELEVVPAGQARDVGLDRCFIGAYGQDDRASVFCSLEAILSIKEPIVSAIALFVDKEEIGSEGSTSINSRWIELMMASFMEAANENSSFIAVIRALAASQALSADVTAALDPDFPEVHDRRNAALIGHGIALTKYTGHGGKYGANDAHAEYVAWLRKIWDDFDINWQAASMGKIDEGGGGTIAKFLASYCLNIADAGPALLSMHSPFEISHKADIYATMQAFKAFYQA